MVVEMGGGRRALGDRIDPSVGFVMHVAPGARVTAGDLLAEVHAADEGGAARASTILRAAVAIGEGPVQARPLVSHRVESGGVERL